MIAVLTAITPIVGVLLLGKAVATTRIVSEEGWLGLESITYYVLLPAIIISKLSIADFTGVDWRMPLALVSAQLVIAALSVLLSKASQQPASRVGAFVQSGVRWNTFIALAIAQDLMGTNGVALVAAAAAALTPTANLISILALLTYSDSHLNIGMLVRKILLNPLILALAFGLSINQLGLELAGVLTGVLDILGQAAIALGLLSSGAAIRLVASGTPHGVIAGWSLLRLLGLPVFAGLSAYLLGVPGPIFFIIILATAVPTASNGAILARQLGGDARLAANLIAYQTLMAMITLTGALWLAETYLPIAPR